MRVAEPHILCYFKSMLCVFLSAGSISVHAHAADALLGTKLLHAALELISKAVYVSNEVEFELKDYIKE